MAFYEVEIPSALTPDTDNFKALAASYASESFWLEEQDYKEVKSSLEAAIEGLNMIVLRDENGGEILSEYVTEDTYSLPTTLDGHALIGWYSDSDDVLYAPGDTVAVSGTTTFYVVGVAADFMTTNTSYGIRVYEDEEGDAKVGIRFTATVDTAALAAAVDGFGITVKNYGILVAPKAYVDAAGAFTLEALERFALNEGLSSVAYLAISSGLTLYDMTDPSASMVAGSVVNLSEATLKNNPDFVAIGFVELDTDGVNGCDTILYGAYDPANAVNYKSVATMALENLENTEDPAYALLEELIASFAS